MNTIESHRHINFSKDRPDVNLKRGIYIASVIMMASLTVPSASGFSTKLQTLHQISLLENKRYNINRNKLYSGACRHFSLKDISYTRLNLSKNGSDDVGGDKNRSERSNNPKRTRNSGKSNNKGKGKRPPKKFTQQNVQTEAKNEVEMARKIADLQHRVTQLESLVASQQVELRKYRAESDKLSDASDKLNQVIDLLRQAGLSADQRADLNKPGEISSGSKISLSGETKGSEKVMRRPQEEFEYFDDEEIFGSAPSSVTDAADAAGSSILAALLAGKQRMLVDVRDAELTRDPDVLTQFIELAILPVAAGLEGLKTKKNRVKIIFPTVSLLMQYRKSMALAAPEVVSLSTLGFDPVEAKDNLVVIVAPAPDDDEGLMQMNELVSSPNLRQPVVVLNHHMVPLLGPCGEFDTVYHLRLLSVQYMTGDKTMNERDTKKDNGKKSDQDEELEAAMEHAHDQGVHQGVTRAMVIRAYPRPWHVFVDTSPDSDADFEVAATFDEIPSADEVNLAIVECLEGSEREDELVAQQMQEALELGQLNTVSEMLGIPNVEIDSELYDDEDDEDEDEDDDPWWNGTDTV